MNSKFHLEFYFKMQVPIRNIWSKQERSWLGVYTDQSSVPFPKESACTSFWASPSLTCPNAEQRNWSKMLRFSSRKLSTAHCTRLCLPLCCGYHLINPGISSACEETAPQNITWAAVSQAFQVPWWWKQSSEPHVIHILPPSILLSLHSHKAMGWVQIRALI